jgi:hypothetical protein
MIITWYLNKEVIKDRNTYNKRDGLEKVKLSWIKKLMVQRYSRELADRIFLNFVHKGEYKEAGNMLNIR